MRKILAALLLACTGCASKHPYHAQVPAYNRCDAAGDVCELGIRWIPNQLTPGGCVVHAIVTGGHVAWECRKPKNGVTPAGGRWIW